MNIGIYTLNNPDFKIGIHGARGQNISIAMEIKATYCCSVATNSSDNFMVVIIRIMDNESKWCPPLFSSQSKTLMTPDLEPAATQFSALLKATLWTGEVIPDMV